MNDNKPFLTEDDADKAYEISTCTEAIDYYSGFRAAAEKANARIAELENQIADAHVMVAELEKERDGLFNLSVLAYDALSVIKTEPTMSGSVLAAFDRKKFF